MAFFYKTKRVMMPVSLGLASVLVGTFLAQAQSVDWQIKGNNFESKSLPLGVPLQINVNGGSVSLQPERKESAGTEGATESANTRTYKFTRDKWELIREVKLDAKRNALRVLDTFTNKSGDDINLRADYNTPLTRGRNVRFNGTISDNGEYREQGNGTADNTIGVIAMAEAANSEALPLFIWGQQSAPWPLNVSDVSSYMRFGYEGIVPANGKISLLHWVATAGLDKNVKLEQTFDLFWKDQKLVNPMLTPEQLATVVNYQADALKGVDSAVESTEEYLPLVQLDALCERLSIARSDKAVLSMGTNGTLEGQFNFGGLDFVSVEGEAMTLAAAQIAALRGGAGLGRLHKVYLRDGSVLVGKTTLKDAAFNAGTGSITMDSAALDLVVAARHKDDGKKPANASYSISALNGEWLWAESLQTGTFTMAASFGKVQLPASDIVEWKRQAEPPFQYEVRLKEGSHINGIFVDKDVTVKLAGGRDLKMPVVKISSIGLLKNAAQENASLASCELRDGSVLKGEWQQVALKLHLGISEVPFKSNEVARFKRAEAGTFEVELTNGSKFKGQLGDSTIVWNMSGKAVTLPVALVSAIQQANAPVESNADASSTPDPEPSSEVKAAK